MASATIAGVETLAWFSLAYGFSGTLSRAAAVLPGRGRHHHFDSNDSNYRKTAVQILSNDSQ
jgi:hypothetical protein